MKSSLLAQMDRHASVAFLAWALCSALYLWTANGVVVRDSDRSNAWHHYEYLVDGFLSGHLHLSIAPAAELLALPDPYDPAQNLHYRLWDASLYRGHYYLYYGPTPAVLLMLPWKLVTGHHLPQRLATGIFAVGGLGALTLLLAGIRRRYFAAVSPAALFWIVLVTGHINWLPVTLRRPAFWELPIVAATALFWGALYCWWRFFETEARRWGIATGVMLALVLGARPTYLFAVGSVVSFSLLLRGTAPSLIKRLPQLIPIVVPVVMGGLLLLLYNYARFGCFSEFGQSYQLWGMDERKVQHFSPAYFCFNAWNYFFSVPDLSIYFPFLRSGWSVDLPNGYIATEAVHGLFFTMPVHVLGIAAFIHCLRPSSRSVALPIRALVFAGSAATGFAALILFCFAGACSRYITELVAGATVVTSIAALAAFSRRISAPGVIRLLGITAAIWSVSCVWLASYGFRNYAPITQPTAYPMIAKLMNYPSYWAARWQQRQFGPVVLNIRLADSPKTGSTPLLGAGSEGMLDQLVLERITPDKVRLRMTANNLILLETPVIPCAGETLRVECGAPWLYPPSAHPFWRALEPGEAKNRQTTYFISVHGTEYSRRSWWGFDATRFDPVVRSAKTQPEECAWIERWAYVEPSRWRDSGGMTNARSAKPPP